MKSPLIIVLIGFFVVLVACKKEKTVDPPQLKSQNIAPCDTVEMTYDSTAIYFDGSETFPQARYRIVLFNTSNPTGGRFELAFNKIPQSGMYYLVHDIDTAITVYENQLAIVNDYIGFKQRSIPTAGAEIYIENNAQEIVVSYCTITNTYFTFDSATLTYFGNTQGPFRLRVQK